MGVTPQLLVKDVVLELMGHLHSLYGKEWYFVIKNNFTEYCLYWIYSIMKGHDKLYTTEGNPLLDVDEERSVLHMPKHPEVIKNVVHQLLTDKKYHFLLMQGWLNINLE